MGVTACSSFLYFERLIFRRHPPSADVINTSALPEAKLAREAEIAYQMVCMSTDLEGRRGSHHSQDRRWHNSANAKRLLLAILPGLEETVNQSTLKLDPNYRGTVKFPGVTAKEKRNPEIVAKLEYILPGYF